MTSINSNLISVVIQGPLYRKPKHPRGSGIFDAISSIKTHLPDAEIIISTWQNEDLSGLENFKTVLNEDPGGFRDSNLTYRNFNRQLVSTRTGITASTRPFVLKTRADVVLIGPQIASLKESTCSIFKSPVTTTNFFVRDISVVPFLFHLSDVVQFGRREDLLDLWESDTEEERDITTHSNKFYFFRYSSSKFDICPEQALCIYWMRRHGFNIRLPHPGYLNKNYTNMWINTLISNFYLIDSDNSGLKFPPHFFNSAYKKNSVYTQNDLKKIERCDSDIKRARMIYLKAIFFTRLLCPLNKIFWLSCLSNLLFKFPKLYLHIFTLYRDARNK